MVQQDKPPEQVDFKISPGYAALKRTWHVFCNRSSIHGLKYTRDEDTNRIVRYIWLLIFVVMLICAIVMVHRFYLDYRSTLTRMNVENDNVPVTSLYFPSVTICPEVLFNIEKAAEYINGLRLPSGIQSKDVLWRLRIFSGFMVDDEHFEKQDIDMMQRILDLNNLTLTAFVSQLRWSCDELLYRCRYYGDIVDCNELFQQSLTFFGHCCSFNLKQQGLNFTNKYAGAGLYFGLSLILRYKMDDFDPFEAYSHGFKLLIQEKDAFPSAHAVSKFIALGTEQFAAIRTEEVFCARTVRELSIDARQCVLPHEIHLKYFPEYVYPNCELSCRVMNMVRFCGCLTYFFDFNRTRDRICTFTDIPCLVGNYTNIMTRLRKTQCNCPPNCEYFEYDVQLSDAELQLNMPTVDPFYDGIKEKDAVVHLFMNSQFYRRVSRVLLSDMVTLISNLGSAFSLFVGMSMLSIIEIIYYSTLVLRKYYKQECEARERLLFRKNAKSAELLRERTMTIAQKY